MFRTYRLILLSSFLFACLIKIPFVSAQNSNSELATQRLAEARAMEVLAERTGCFRCHSVSDNKVGPSFAAIATRYVDGPSPSELLLLTVPSIAELPEKMKSKVVIGRIGESFHLRVFDAMGRKIVDKAEAELLQGPALAEFKQQLAKTRTFGANEDSRAGRLSLVSRAAMLTGRESVEEHLFRVIKSGGKGNWKDISKGSPMPPHSASLKDEEIKRLVKWLLAAKQVKVMKTGLGSGTVTSSLGGIDCGGDCNHVFTAGESLTLTATAAAGSVFVGWDGDATGSTNTATITMDANRSVRARFDLADSIPQLTDFTPEGIRTFLAANPSVNSPARFVYALPEDFKQNWILMTRSESLQTGTAESPRILLPRADASAVFTIGLTEHVSYPGSHPLAIEYMQWDAVEKNFRFHEITVGDVPPMSPFPGRPRGVSIDDAKCSKCHSTQNVLNRSPSPGFPGTTGTSFPFTIKAKNKPNWDTYDSWGGMMPFNRDRIYKGTVEAAAFRQLLNLWTWESKPEIRAIIDQLQLQPPDSAIGSLPAAHKIERERGGTYDGHINFTFDDAPPVRNEPLPVGSANNAKSDYLFNNTAGGIPTDVLRGMDETEFITLHHSIDPSSDEGRGVELFDQLTSFFNPARVADELIHHNVATGSVDIDVRPIALAITRRLLTREGNSVVVDQSMVPGKTLTVPLVFFGTRNGMSIDQLYQDTRERAISLTRRKADVQKLNLDRVGDIYLSNAVGGAAQGLIAKYGTATHPTQGTDASMERIRQEVFRRPTGDGGGDPDQTIVMGGLYTDRENYVNGEFNSEFLTLYRYFLEPLGVSVDKWSMGVRGRSRTYTFADLFGSYTNAINGTLTSSLESDRRDTGLPGGPFTDEQLIDAVNLTLAAAKLPPVSGPGAIPRFTDIQRLFNKSCIECHGGLEYPPYVDYGSFLDFSEDETATAGPSVSPRLARSHNRAATMAGTILNRLLRPSEDCPNGMMPCGGPRLSQVDIETFRRWRAGGSPFTVGDPHIQTVDGTIYDFQAHGEFVFLRGENLEIQVRQTAVQTETAQGPNEHSGLSTGVSINTAVALRVGSHRVTYQPDLTGKTNTKGLELRIDGKLITMNGNGVSLGPDGRIMPTSAPGGIQVEAVGGTTIVITPNFWDHYQVWFLDIVGRQVRETDGLMGLVAPGNWLPAMPDGSWLGPKPEEIQHRFDVLYKKFGEAWRITDKDSLFDYAPGTSARTFALEGWPSGIDGLNLKPPARTQPLADKEPLRSLAREKAEELCAQIKDDTLRKLAIQDVMVTGDSVFAKAASLTATIIQNSRPSEPQLNFPEDNRKDLASSVSFTWNSSTDADGDPLSYRLSVWPVDMTPDDNQAIPLGRSRDLKQTRTVSQMEPGRSYYWKVIVEDGRGGVSESVIRRFTVSEQSRN